MAWLSPSTKVASILKNVLSSYVEDADRLVDDSVSLGFTTTLVLKRALLKRSLLVDLGVGFDIVDGCVALIDVTVEIGRSGIAATVKVDGVTGTLVACDPEEAAAAQFESGAQRAERAAKALALLRQQLAKIDQRIATRIKAWQPKGAEKAAASESWTSWATGGLAQRIAADVSITDVSLTVCERRAQTQSAIARGAAQGALTIKLKELTAKLKRDHSESIEARVRGLAVIGHVSERGYSGRALAGGATARATPYILHPLEIDAHTSGISEWLNMGCSAEHGPVVAVTRICSAASVSPALRVAFTPGQVVHILNVVDELGEFGKFAQMRKFHPRAKARARLADAVASSDTTAALAATGAATDVSASEWWRYAVEALSAEVRSTHQASAVG